MFANFPETMPIDTSFRVFSAFAEAILVQNSDVDGYSRVGDEGAWWAFPERIETLSLTLSLTLSGNAKPH